MSSDDVLVDQPPLEVNPIIAASIEYGRRTFALGAVKGASMLSKIADMIRSTPLDRTEDVAQLADDFARELKSLMTEAYRE